MAYLAINGKLLKVDGKYVTVSESSGASGEPQTKTVTATTRPQTVTADSGYYLSSVTVNAINLQIIRGIVPTKEVQGISYNSDYDGIATVYVEPIPDDYIIPSGTLDITANGSHDVKAYESVTVNIPEPKLEYRTVTPAKEGFKIYPSGGYDGISEVWVNPIPSSYITPTGDLSITENGTHNVTEYSTVTVNVPTLDTSDATATPEDIASGKTAYVNGEKITGTATGSSSGSGSNATFSFDVATATLTITEG